MESTPGGRRSKLALVVAFATLTASGPAFGQGSQAPAVNVPRRRPVEPDATPPDVTFGYRVGAAARVNPLGLFVSGTAMLRKRLYRHQALALRDNYVGVGPVFFMSPAFARGGLGVEVQPLSVLQLSASLEGIGFFRTFEFMQSFPSATSETSDGELKRLKEAGTNYATTGWVTTLAALLQGKAGPMALRSNFRAIYYDMRLRDGDRVWYDSILDVMSPGKGWTFTNDTDLLYVTSFGLAAGARFTATHSAFQSTDFTPGEAENNPNSPITRVGPFVAYTFFDKPCEDGVCPRFNAPTVVLVSQWFLAHRYRTGQEVSQAVPWFALAFQCKGDLL